MYEDGIMGKIVFLFFSMLVLSCQRDISERELKLLRMGALYQQAKSIKVEAKQVPFAWSLYFSFENKGIFCFYLRKNKKRYDLRLVKNTGNGCHFNENILEEVGELDHIKLEEVKEQKIFSIQDKKHLFHFTISLPLEPFRGRDTSLCGRRKQDACYRGRSYKKNVITSCNEHNEEYFCAEGLTLYCNQGKYECL